MDRIQIKEMAKKQIGGQIGILLLIYIILFAIFYVSLSILPIAAYALLAILDISLCSIYLRLADGTAPDIKSFFDIFKNGRLCGNSILLYLLIYIFTFLWSLLLIVPGIVKAYSYAMAPYILIENEYYMSPLDALKESQRIMDGHKMELFVLSLSFIGWILLSMLTCGILFVFVIPYKDMSFVNFYNQIKDKPEII